MIRLLVPSALVFALIGCSGGATETPAPEPAPAPTEPAPTEPAPKPGLDVPPERAMEVKLPSGATVTGDHVVAPADGTVEKAIVESINLIGKGEFDVWIKEWCHSSACGTPEGIEQLKLYNLPAAQGTSKECLGADGNSVTITRRDPPEADGLTRVFVYCGEKRMPAPSAHYLDGGRYKVTSFSW
jgi:hypothetical protein